MKLQLRKRRQERDQPQSKARQSMDGSKSQGQKDEQEKEVEEESEVRFVALKAELEKVRQYTRRVKDMVGIAEAQEVLPKLEQQMENMQHLLKARAENQVGQGLAQMCLSALSVQYTFLPEHWTQLSLHELSDVMPSSTLYNARMEV